MLRRIIALGAPTADAYLDRIVCALGAIGFAQAPEYFQQYFQRLGGHLDEALRQLAQFQAAAQASGKPWAQFVNDTLGNPDPGLARLGATLRDTAERVADLQAAHDALAGATVWTRPFVFLKHADWSIAQAALEVYKPAVPTTLEGAVYAAFGVALALGLWQLTIRRPIKAWLGKRRPTP